MRRSDKYFAYSARTWYHSVCQWL